MSLQEAKSELLGAGLHQQSVDRMLEHYEAMQFHLQAGQYDEIGNDVGNFCENAANVVLSSMREPIRSNISFGQFMDDMENGVLNTSADRGLRLTIPRMLRSAYELRSTRDYVHTDLENPVNHADSQTAVEICSWVLADLIRIHGTPSHMDEIAGMIEDVTSPDIPFIDDYGDEPPLVLHDDITTGQEALIHMYFTNGQTLNADELIERIPGSNANSVKGALGRFKQNRDVRYDSDSGRAVLTAQGRQRARSILETEFDDADYVT